MSDDKITEAIEWLDHKFRGTTIYEGHPIKTVYAVLEAKAEQDRVMALMARFYVIRMT